MKKKKFIAVLAIVGMVAAMAEDVVLPKIQKRPMLLLLQITKQKQKVHQVIGMLPMTLQLYPEKMVLEQEVHL